MPSLQICLVSDDSLIENAVRLAARDAETTVFSIRGTLSQENVLSGSGARLVKTAQSCDVVLMEWNLDSAPRLNTLCFQIRRSTTVPVFMLTSGAPEEQVGSIAAGADDAIGFPLNMSLLRAKILSYHRLVKAAQDAVTADRRKAKSARKDVGQFGPLRLDRTGHRFYVDGKEVELTPREFALIDYLIGRQNELCTRDEILDRVWGIRFDTGTNMVDVYMHFLRRKLEAQGLATMLETIRGRGYRLVLPYDR